MKLNYLSHKTKLYPSPQAEEYLNKACGIARFSYNWGLVEWQRSYKAGEKPTAYRVRNTFNSIRKEQFPWSYEVTKWASQTGFENLGKDSFTIGQDNLKIKGRFIRLPNHGWVKMAEGVRFPGQIKQATISRSGSNWYVSILVKLDPSYKYTHQCKNQAKVGIDLGLSWLATLSDGTVILNIRPYKNLELKLARAQKALSRKVKGSKNRLKAKMRVADIHHKIYNRRNTYLHQVTTGLIKNYKHIVLEDLNVAGMIKNKKLSKSINDASWGEFRRQLEYKAQLAGNTIVIANRFFASSKLCSACEYKNIDLKLTDREWICGQCGTVHNRDLNAAQNLLNLVTENFPDTLNACGDLVRLDNSNIEELRSMKQEINALIMQEV
jgi:putative transposase